MEFTYLRSLIDANTALPALVQALNVRPSDPGRLASLLEAEIKRMTETLHDLKTCRNSLVAPVYNLPAEILADIFYIHAAATNALFSLRWTSIMLVCRTWREIGLSTASLWNCINLARASRHPTRLRERFRRSQNYPLDIQLQFDLGDRGPLWIDGDILPLVPARLRSLCVLGLASSEVVTQFLQQLAAHASNYPQLRVLKLHFSRSQETEDPLLLPRLTNELVAGGALSLSILELRHMVVKWELVSSHLTRLRLIYSAVDPVNALDALLRCPSLLVLDLQLDSLEDAYIGNSRSTVHLSVLRYLKLAGDIATCSYFVAFLSMPSSTSIYLSSPATLDELRSSRICALFRKHYKGSGARAVRGLQLDYGRYHGDFNHLVLTVYSHDNPHVYPRDEFGNDAPYLSINILETTHHQVRKAIVDILHILPTRHIDSVYAGYSLPLPQKTWKTVLSLLSPLRKACAHPETTASSLLAVMRWILETKQTRPVAHLRLDCEHTGRGKDDDDGAQKLEIAKAAFQASLSLMAKAKNCGVPLAMFELAGNPGSCMDLLDNLPVKSVYRLLSTGFMFGSHIFNKASTKEDIVQRRAKYGKDSIPRSSGDSDVDAEISAEEEGHLAVDM